MLTALISWVIVNLVLLKHAQDKFDTETIM